MNNYFIFPMSKNMLPKVKKPKNVQVKNAHSLKKALCLKYKEFCQHSSLHGFYYFYGSTSIWTHISWCLILVCSTALCGYLSHMIWEKYALNPTFTIFRLPNNSQDYVRLSWLLSVAAVSGVTRPFYRGSFNNYNTNQKSDKNQAEKCTEILLAVETTQWATEKVPFPALSVCDPQIIYTPSAKNITHILKLRGYNESSVNEFFNSFSNMKKADYTPPEFVKKMHSTLEDLGYNYNFLINELRMPCDVLLQRCLWRSKQFDCSVMFRSVFSVAGYCCQFDLKFFSAHAEMGVKFTAGIDISEALDIVVNTQKTTDDVISNGRVFMYIFDSKNELTLMDSSITLSSATYFDVNIDVWVIDSSDDVRALSLKDRQCFLESDTKTMNDSYQGCIMAYMMRKVVHQCKCMPFNYTASQLHIEELPLCTWQKSKCVYESLEKIQADMRHVISMQDCYQKCDYIQYETETELVMRDRSTSKEDEKTCRVTVHFGDTTCIKYRREVLYSWDQMLANLGGIFGLCLGGSVVSIIEILWLFVELVYTTAVGIRRRKVSSKNNVVVLKQNTKSLPMQETKNDLPFIN